MFTLKDFRKLTKKCDISAFYNAIEIYLRKPQVINRKLNTTTNSLTAWIEVERKKDFLEVFEKNCDQHVTDLLHKNNINYKQTDLSTALNHIKDPDNNGLLISVSKIIPRNAVRNTICLQISIFCKKTNTVSFYAFNDESKILPQVNYSIQFEIDEQCIKLFVDDSNVDVKWLQNVLLDKLQNWTDSYNEEEQFGRIESHSLINNEDYAIVYGELKEKYGKRFEAIWTEEATDPKKYVYEDIAIAAYLISFWKANKSKGGRKESFVDLGCGNGLLVAILSNEGHRGFGIDIRRRKIWSKFDESVDLREITWNPTYQIEDDIDWVIGNHSDELSPWIPVIAARKSISCNYFLLPCCAYEFSGTKFQRKGTSKSLYMSYLDYLAEISSVCGFERTLMDRLKIPSTKRVCLIGMNRIYGENQMNDSKVKIQNFIDLSNRKFVPREKQQLVKNCTKIDKNLTEKIVKIIFDALYADSRHTDEHWDQGKEIAMSDAVNLISSDDLKVLKRENGGLQTLLKNKNQIFDIQKGKIKIRKPKRISERSDSLKKSLIKSSPCYFHLHHKQGCLLKDEECSFMH